MGIAQKDIKLLWGRAANRCAICRIELSHESATNGIGFPIGEQAHIVAEEAAGSRGNSPLTLEDRNSYHNLILLCPNHHTLIDRTAEEYPVERLHIIKSKHELWVQQTLSKEISRNNTDLIDLSDLVVFFELVKPLFIWLYKPIPKETAQSFFQFTQLFWTVRNLATEQMDHRLVRAMDNLIRPLASGKQTLFNDAHYAMSKIYIASSLFIKYFSDKGLESIEPERDDTTYDLTIQLAINCENILRNADRLDDIEIATTKYTLYITNYYENYIKSRGHTSVPEILFNQHLYIIDLFLIERLGVQLTDTHDANRLDRLYQACSGKLFEHAF